MGRGNNLTEGSAPVRRTGRRDGMTFAAAREHVAQVNAEIIGLFGSTHGRCQLASELLAKRLSDLGRRPVLMHGLYEQTSSPYTLEDHTWVQCDELTLDPTRDQFGDDPLAEHAGSYSAAYEDSDTDQDTEIELTDPDPMTAATLLERMASSAEQQELADRLRERYKLPLTAAAERAAVTETLGRFEALQPADGWTCDGGALVLEDMLTRAGVQANIRCGIYKEPGSDPEDIWDGEHHHWVQTAHGELIDPNGENRSEPRRQPVERAQQKYVPRDDWELRRDREFLSFSPVWDAENAEFLSLDEAAEQDPCVHAYLQARANSG